MTNDDKDLKLKECPFCGGMPILKQWPQLNKLYLGDDSKSIWSIFCSNCLFEGIRHSKEIVLLKWNTRHPQQPSEPLKELDAEKIAKHIRYWWGSPNFHLKEYLEQFGQPEEPKLKLSPFQLHEIAKGDKDVYGELMILHGYARRTNPSEKKALSVEDMKKIAHEAIRQENVAVYSWKVRDIICHAIHSAMPARKEVKWPEKKFNLKKKYKEHYDFTRDQGFDDGVESCINAYEEAMPAQREVRYPEKRYSCKTCNGVGWWAEQVSDTEQEQRKCPDCYSGETPPDMEYNEAIDEFKKLNGG